VARVILSVAPLLLGLPLLSGCDDGYSEDLRYPLRKDPLLDTKGLAEAKHPDQPGELPVMTYADLEDSPLDLYKLPKLNQAFDPDKIKGDQRKQLDTGLNKLFGTPAQPKVAVPDDKEGVDAKVIQALKLDEATLADGSRLFRTHCLHCHGLTGDGRGPTSFWLNPHPRDYRKGVFKFVSTSRPQGSSQAARREDLLRTLRVGLNGSAMPAFNILTDHEQEAIVSYVIHLSLRGEVELDAMTTILKGGVETTLDKFLGDGLKLFAGEWVKAQSEIITPDPYPYDENNPEQLRASIERGYKFFMDEANGCIKCHPGFGRYAKFRWDDWGTMVKPIDLTMGIYRGGRRPIDLYWRIHGGINGSGMAGFKDNLKASDDKKTHLLWDVVNFIQILPYPQMRQKYKIPEPPIPSDFLQS